MHRFTENDVDISVCLRRWIFFFVRKEYITCKLYFHQRRFKSVLLSTILSLDNQLKLSVKAEIRTQLGGKLPGGGGGGGVLDRISGRAVRPGRPNPDPV